MGRVTIPTLPPDVARSNVLRVITRKGLLPEVMSELRSFGYTIDTASPDRIRRAGVVAVQNKHIGVHSNDKKKYRQEEDAVIADLARAIGLKPTVETIYYHKTQNEYTSKYGKNSKQS